MGLAISVPMVCISHINVIQEHTQIIHLQSEKRIVNYAQQDMHAHFMEWHMKIFRNAEMVTIALKAQSTQINILLLEVNIHLLKVL